MIVVFAIVPICDDYNAPCFSHVAVRQCSLIRSVEKVVDLKIQKKPSHPVLKQEDRLGKEPFAGFCTVVEDITGSGYTKNQPILLGPF